MGIKEILGEGPHGKALGLDKLIHTQRLEQALDLVKTDGLPVGEALALTDTDLSNIPSPILNDIVRSQPAEVQQQIAQWASGDAGNNTNTPSPSSTSSSTTPSTTNSSATTSPTGPAPGSNGVGPTGTPPGNAYGRTDVPRGPDPGFLTVPASSLVASTVQTVSSAPSALIQRVFNAEGPRVDSPQAQAAIAKTTGGETVRPETTQVVTMPRNANGEAHRAERAQQNQIPGNIPQRGDAVQNAANRNDGRAPFAQQPANAQNAQGNPATQQAMAHTQAAPQGAAQAAGFAAQQTAAQAAPQQANNRQMGEQPGQQLNPRAADAAVGSQRVQDARPAFAAPDPRGFTPQQQLPSQAVQPAQARPEIMAAQVMPQLAGLTVVANPQIPAVNTQLNQNAAPVASGAENATSQARDALLAPAGHTLAGFLRRDHRGRAQALRKPVDWVLAMMPGARKRKGEGEAEATSFQWLFWILTVAAYGAIATAIITMAPTGGSLLDDRGNPSIGAYALIVGGIAAIASWLIGRRLAK